MNSPNNDIKLQNNYDQNLIIKNIKNKLIWIKKSLITVAKANKSNATIHWCIDKQGVVANHYLQIKKLMIFFYSGIKLSNAK